jgi:HEAT repeats/HEAT repeat
MNEKARTRIGVLSAAALLIGTCAIFRSGPGTHGTLIEGKPVSFWTGKLRHAEEDVDLLVRLLRHSDETTPALVRQLSLAESPTRNALNWVWRNLPLGMRRYIPEPRTPSDLRAGAAWGLFLLGNPETHGQLPTETEARAILPAVKAALADKNDLVRLNAAACLGNFQCLATQAVGLCAVGLNDPFYGVRFNAVNSLSKLASVDSEAIPLLRQSLNDANPDVRKRAAQALEKPPK